MLILFSFYWWACSIFRILLSTLYILLARILKLKQLWFWGLSWFSAISYLVNFERELQSLNIFPIAAISKSNFRYSFSRHTSARLHAQWSTLSTYLVNHSVHPFDMVIKEFHCIEFGSAEFQYFPRSYSEWGIEFHSLMPLLWERHFQLLQCKLLQLREVYIMYLWR